mgnify:FL=1
MQNYNIKYYFILIILFNSSAHSHNNRLESIWIESKINGIMITMKLDSILSVNNISAWQAKSGWFYITLYKVIGDTLNLQNINLPDEILDFQLMQNDESLQIGLRLNNHIDNYDFSHQNKSSLIASLHYSTEYLSKIDSIKPPQKSIKRKGLNSGIKKWLYLSGAGISLAGTLSEKKTYSKLQTQVGITIIIGTYIIDRIWKIL